MKSVFTLNHLFKIAGKKGDALGVSEPMIYFDGERALAANQRAVVWIDCHQPLDTPILIPVREIKTAQTISSVLSIRKASDGVSINGVRVFSQSTIDVIPPETQEIIDLDRGVWRTVIAPFRFDGSRLGQVVPAMASPKGEMKYLSGAYVDFSSGALVATDGVRLHLVEDVVPDGMTVDEKPGLTIPSAVVTVLAGVGGVQEMFVLLRHRDVNDVVQEVTPPGEGNPVEEKEDNNTLVCIGAANAKFRIRALTSGEFPAYRSIYADHKNYPLRLMFSQDDVEVMKSIARIALRNGNYPMVRIESRGQSIVVSHYGRVTKELPAVRGVKQPFSIQIHSRHLLEGLDSAQCHGFAVVMRCAPGLGSAAYIGARDFHSILKSYPDDLEETAPLGAKNMSEEPFPAISGGLQGGF